MRAGTGLAGAAATGTGGGGVEGTGGGASSAGGGGAVRVVAALRLASLLAIEAPARLVTTRFGASVGVAGAALVSFFDEIIARTDPCLIESIPSE